jgi:hypothetical protein
MEANGSIFTNKYSEGLPGARYYGGNEVSHHTIIPGELDVGVQGWSGVGMME